jgi:hypothetical protein
MASCDLESHEMASYDLAFINLSETSNAEAVLWL